ncbi:MAG: CDP-alcohol phosphatidyltransferase family protein [Planctomycetota bacterium]|jgi:phosphatidylglycerophosphate synthase
MGQPVTGNSRVPPWLPNLVSGLRIVLVPVWLLVAESCRDAALVDLPTATYRTWSVVVLCSIGVSDVLDGWLARRFQLASQMGATLDAFADKLFQVVLVTFFTLRAEPAFHCIPLWFLVLLLGRDVLLGLGGVVVQGRIGEVHVFHRVHGKISSVLLFVLLFLVTADVATGLIAPGTWLIATIVMLSTAAYVRAGVRQLRSRQGS